MTSEQATERPSERSEPWVIVEAPHPTYAGGRGNEPDQLYAKALYNTKYGHALFDPPSTELSAVEQQHPVSVFQRRGIHIGDVGFLWKGSFVSVFNILASDENGAPPDSFSPYLVPRTWNRVRYLDDVPRGEIMMSRGTTKEVNGLGIALPLDPIGGVLANVAGKVEFSTKEKHCATLCLPTGANWDEVINYGCMESYVLERAGDWMSYINSQSLGYKSSNGSVLVVTGYASSKCYASSVRSERNRERGVKFALSLASVGPEFSRLLSWSHADGFTTHVKPADSFRGEGSLDHEHYLFVRGYLLSFRKRFIMWKKKVTVRDGITKTVLPAKKKSGGSSSGKNNQSDTKTQFRSQNQSGSQRGLAELMNICDEDYHPLLLINDILLDFEPRASFAMSHDDNMSALLEAGEEIPDREVLKDRMKQKCKWRFNEETGVVLLNPPDEKSSSIHEPLHEWQFVQPPATSISHNASEAKRSPEGRPATVETPKFVLKLSTPAEKENIDPNKTKVAGKKTLEKQLSPPSLSLNIPLVTPRHACSSPTPRSLSVY